MDESALRIALISLDTRWSSLEHWLWISTGTVLIGVALEFWVLVQEWKTEKSDFLRGSIHSPEHPSKFKFVLEILGVGLITLGILGELIVGFKASKVETDMRTDTARLVALIDQKAQDAKDDAERLENENRKLEAQIADRHITVEQRWKMLEILAAGRGTPIAIGHITDSGSDAQAYSLELGEVFCDAKWIVSQPVELTSYDSTLHGFLLEAESEASLKSRPHFPSQMPPSAPASKRLIGLTKKALAVTGYKTLVQTPSSGLGGNIAACKTPPSAGSPAWYPTALEILVGSK
jgi:hypothetical protein